MYSKYVAYGWAHEMTLKGVGWSLVREEISGLLPTLARHIYPRCVVECVSVTSTALAARTATRRLQL